MRKRISMIVGMMLVLSVSTISCRQMRQTEPSAVTPAFGSSSVPMVTVAHGVAGESGRDLKLTGSIEPYEQAVLYARVTGYVSEVRVDIGDEVVAGQIVAIISVPDLNSRLKSAEAEIAAAAARVEKAEADSALLGLKWQVNVARAELQSAEAKRDELRSLADYSSVRAPFRGTITRRMADQGNLVTASSTSSPIVEIARVDLLRLKMDIPDYAADKVKTGQSVSFYLSSAEGRKVETTITRTAHALSPSTRTMRAECDLNNLNSEYQPGMFCSVFLKLEGLNDDLRVPSRAVHKEKSEVYVLTVDNGRANKVAVEVTYDNGKECLVRGRLSPAIPIIVSAPLTVSAGDSVRVANGGSRS